jgi:hypothetical protein
MRSASPTSNDLDAMYARMSLWWVPVQSGDHSIMQIWMAAGPQMGACPMGDPNCNMGSGVHPVPNVQPSGNTLKGAWFDQMEVYDFSLGWKYYKD